MGRGVSRRVINFCDPTNGRMGCLIKEEGGGRSDLCISIMVVGTRYI